MMKRFNKKIADTIKHSGVPVYFWRAPGCWSVRCYVFIRIIYIFRGSEMGLPSSPLNSKKVMPLDHRNVLGELMHLGITRESIGDIDVGVMKRYKLSCISGYRSSCGSISIRLKWREIRTTIKDQSKIGKLWKELQAIVCGGCFEPNRRINTKYGVFRDRIVLF